VTAAIQYRSFRNTDPPGLAEVWNDSLTGRGAVRLKNASPLERFTFSKIFFDADGLIVAEAEGRCVGFAHAGFGAKTGGGSLDMQTGVICMLAVCPPYRGQGIGSELLRRSEQYLRSRGAQHLWAGPHSPLDPFYLGLYGGSEMPGFLQSDPAAELFITRRGYNVSRTVGVLQRRLGASVKVFDPRFIGHRQRYELCEDAASHLGSWWQYALFNGVEPRVFALLDKTTGEPAAQATVWEMDGFSFRWNTPAIGVVNWFVRSELRRQGVGKFFLTQLMRKAQEELLEVMEVQVATENLAAIKMCQGLGFEQVDLGRMYQKQD
jgi:ribosomal protein S18 acetylase RimI-like enzyme